MRLIDADALLKKLDDSIWYNVADFNEAWYAVDHAPTVEDAPVRHGRWIQVSQDRANCNRCNCESGKMIKQGERYFPKFCPECGADMREDGGND